MEVTVDPAELLAGLDHPGRAPAQRHQSAAPVVMNVAGGCGSRFSSASTSVDISQISAWLRSVPRIMV